MPSSPGFCFSLNYIWNKNKQILQSDELDLVLADAGLGDGSKLLAYESGPVELLKISSARCFMLVQCKPKAIKEPRTRKYYALGCLGD